LDKGCFEGQSTPDLAFFAIIAITFSLGHREIGLCKNTKQKHTPKVRRITAFTLRRVLQLQHIDRFAHLRQQKDKTSILKKMCFMSIIALPSWRL
jgi:hypothetical protein